MMKSIISLLLLTLFQTYPAPGPGRQTHVAAGPVLLSGFPVTAVLNANTTAKDTTGATLLVVFCGFYSNSAACVLTDSASNTWASGTAASQAVGGRAQLMYVYSPTTSASHTFKCTASFCFIVVYAFSGTVGSTIDQQNHLNTSVSSPFQPGSITPSFAKEVIITGGAGDIGSLSAMSVDSGFSTVTRSSNGCCEEGGAAYLVDSATSALNPNISVTASSGAAWGAVIGSFR